MNFRRLSPGSRLAGVFLLAAAPAAVPQGAVRAGDPLAVGATQLRSLADQARGRFCYDLAAEALTRAGRWVPPQESGSFDAILAAVERERAADERKLAALAPATRDAAESARQRARAELATQVSEIERKAKAAAIARALALEKSVQLSAPVAGADPLAELTSWLERCERALGAVPELAAMSARAREAAEERALAPVRPDIVRAGVDPKSFRVLRGARFTIATDRTDDAFLSQAQPQLDAMVERVKSFLGARAKPLTRPILGIAFADRDAYKKFADATGRRELGSFAGFCDSADGRFYLGSHDGWELDMHVLLHEAAHATLHDSMGLGSGAGPTTWLVEGAAEYFETFQIGDKEYGNPRLLGDLYNLAVGVSLAHKITLERLVTSVQYGEVFGKEVDQIYLASWGVFWFLADAQSGKYRERLLTLLDRAASRKYTSRTFVEVMGVADFQALNKEWEKFIEDQWFEQRRKKKAASAPAVEK